jgi:hypothetical protein
MRVLASQKPLCINGIACRKQARNPPRRYHEFNPVTMKGEVENNSSARNLSLSQSHDLAATPAALSLSRATGQQTIESTCSKLASHITSREKHAHIIMSRSLSLISLLVLDYYATFPKTTANRPRHSAHA